jgi:demethylmenaquinone methyltransferase/2-methoxy-6-polyprenyl-1,4-benzoquinol methylase
MSKIEDKENTGWRPLQKMFTEVADRYDIMNRLLTFRFDERWRKMTARECLAGNPLKILDLCTGTGDLAIQIARLTKNKIEITGLDYSNEMLSLAQRKASERNLGYINFIIGDAASLPFKNESLDVICIAFAFRNLTYKNPDVEKFLKEIFRVLSQNGRFIIVETSQPASWILKFLFHTYLKLIVSFIGGYLSGYQKAYKYLATSARNFYSPVEVSDLLLKTGFEEVKHRRLFGGIAGITSGVKCRYPRLLKRMNCM